MATALCWSVFQIHEFASGAAFKPSPKSLVFVGGQGKTESVDLTQTKRDWMQALTSFDRDQVSGIAYRSETGTRVIVKDRQGYGYQLTTPFDNAYCQPGYGTLGGNGQIYLKHSTPVATSKAHLDSFFQQAGYKLTTKTMDKNGQLELMYSRPAQEAGRGQLYSNLTDQPINQGQVKPKSSAVTSWQIRAVVSEQLIVLTLPHEPCYPQREVPMDRTYTVSDLDHVLDDFRWLPGYPVQSFDQLGTAKTDQTMNPTASE
jgi:hypothetical protein